MTCAPKSVTDSASLAAVLAAADAEAVHQPIEAPPSYAAGVADGTSDPTAVSGRPTITWTPPCDPTDPFYAPLP